MLPVVSRAGRWSQKLAFVLCAAWMSASIPAVAGEQKTGDAKKNAPVTLTVLHTNDMHGHLEPWQGWEGELKDRSMGGLDRLSARVNEVRAASGAESVLLLDAGDTLGDSMIAVETEGKALIEVMNAIGYDAMVIGNHEPDFTADKLRQRISEARFPVLAANIKGRKNGQLFTKPYVIRTIQGIKVGILGLAYPNTAKTSAQKNVRNLEFEDAVTAAQREVPRLRRDGAQLVIALTHLGLGADKQLAEKVAGIDVIVGGHSHNRMRDALKVGQTLIVQAGAHGSDLGRLDLRIRGGRIESHTHALIPVTGSAADAKVTAIIQRHRAAYEQKMNATVGQAQTLIARAQTIAGQEPQKRDAESPADDLFADAIRDSTRSEVAFLPGLGYGVAIPPGTITAAALRNLIPHDSAVWTMRLTGDQILQVLEQALENFSSKDPSEKVGGMIQSSGLRFSYTPEAEFGKRVQQVTIGDKPLSPARWYTVAVNGLLAEGGHNYTPFKQGKARREGDKQFDMVRAWIEARGKVSAPATDRIIKAPEKPTEK